MLNFSLTDPMNSHHLGGHQGITHIDEGVIDYMIKTFAVKSGVDVGCGPGGNVLIMRQKGMVAFGIDGDTTVNPTIIHDYTLGPFILEKFVDFGLSTEFVEHVEEKYLPNYMATFKCCKYLVITHALPGETKGHHHVNLQPSSYWINKFEEYGFEYSELYTKEIRKASTMKREFIRKTGMVLINKKDGLTGN